MKYWQLLEIVKYLQKFKKIESIYRIDQFTLKIEFDYKNNIYFYMKRGESLIYKKDNDLRQNQFNRPFDIQLSNRLNKAKISKIEIINNDKIIKIDVQLMNKYKITNSSIQFEFTGKHTNIIILNEDNIIIEALNHVSEFQSVRYVKVGEKLENPPAPNFNFLIPDQQIENIDNFLLENYFNLLNINLTREKNRAKKIIEEKRDRLKKHLAEFESKETVSARADEFNKYGEIVLANFYMIDEYNSIIETVDFNGLPISFKRPTEAKDNSHMAKIFFHNARRLRKKSENLSIEINSINRKLDFFEQLLFAIDNSKSLEEIAILTGRESEKTREAVQQDEPIEIFWIEGYKIMLGRNEKGNINLLERSKANDWWLHLKDRPSAHMIINTDRREISEHILYESAKLLAKLSVSKSSFSHGDKLLIDATRRKFVRIQNGANVLYTNYKTFIIDI